MKGKKYVLYAALASITFYSCIDINLLILDAACITGDINTEQGIILATLQPKDGEKEHILFSKDGNINLSFSPKANTLTDPTSKQLYIGGRYTSSSQGKTYKYNMTLFSPTAANIYIDYNAIDKEIGYAKALGNGLMGLISLDKKTAYVVSIYGKIILTKSTVNTFRTFETTWSADNTHGLLAIGGNNIDDGNNDSMLIPLHQSTNNRCKYTAGTPKVFPSIDTDGTIVDIVFPSGWKSKSPTSDNTWPLLLLVDYGESKGIAIEQITLASDQTETPSSTLAEAVAQGYTLPTEKGDRETIRTTPTPLASALSPFFGDSMVFVSNNNYIGLLVLMHRNNEIYAMSFVQEQLKDGGATLPSKTIPPSPQSIGKNENEFESFSPYMRVHGTSLVVGAIGYTPSTRYFSLLSFSISAPTKLIESNSSLLESKLIHFSKKSQSIPLDTKIEIKDFIYR